MTYKNVQDGEWVYPRRRGYYVKCCDCGLVHKLNFKLEKYGRGKKILSQAYRLRSKTGKPKRKRSRKSAR